MIRSRSQLPPVPVVVIPGVPEPRRRYPRDTAPVVGRVGSRQWAREQAPCFGGGEAR